MVDIAGRLALLAAWNTDGPGGDLAPPLDLVGFEELLVRLAAWGECP